MRLDGLDKEEVEVPMSPLIDCVFLLLIFFLVTTMMKRLEKQIPIELPSSASVPAQATEEQEVIVALDMNGHYMVSQGRDRDGIYQYKPLARADSPEAQKTAFATFLGEVAESELGVETPLRIDADRELGIQKVIDALDIAQIQGFEKVSVRIMHEDNVFFQMPNPGKPVRPDIP
jgi:biopolymer transport protein ExbD